MAGSTSARPARRSKTSHQTRCSSLAASNPAPDAPNAGCSATEPAPRDGSATSNAATGWTAAASKATKAARSGLDGRSSPTTLTRSPSEPGETPRKLLRQEQPLTTNRPREITPRPFRFSRVYPRQVASEIMRSFESQSVTKWSNVLAVKGGAPIEGRLARAMRIARFMTESDRLKRTRLLLGYARFVWASRTGRQPPRPARIGGMVLHYGDPFVFRITFREIFILRAYAISSPGQTVI